MIRILHVVSNMDRGGIETMLMNYYRHIDREKIQFDFLCNKTKPGDYDEEIKRLGGKIYHTPGLNPFKYFKYLKYMKNLFKEHPEYRIIHAHNDAFVAYSLFAAKRNKIPVRISHVHSSAFVFDYKWPLKILCRPIIPRCATNKWACGENAAKFYYGEKAVQKGETHIMHNAIEINDFVFNSTVRNDIRTKYNLKGKFVLGHIGRFDYPKNHSFLIDIFDRVHKKNSESILLLVGEGFLMEKIKGKVHELGLDDCVIFTGSVENPNDYYQAMDVFVMPSKSEGLPVVGIEAQAADLPCFFSDTITTEIDLLPTTQFISTKIEPEKWADLLLSSKKDERVDRSELIKNAGYDIGEEAKKLEQIYSTLY